MVDLGRLMDRLRRVPVLGTAIAVNDRYGKDAGGQLAASIAYFGFLSLFPLLLLGMSVIGFVLSGDAAAQERWVAALTDAVPGLRAATGDSLDALVRNRATTGIVGLLGFIWTGIAVIDATSVATTRVFRMTLNSNILKSKARSLGALLALGGLGFGSMGLALLVGGITSETPIGLALRVGGFLLAVVLDSVLFLVAYRVLCAGQSPSWRGLIPGAVLGGIGWSVLKVLGSWWITRSVAGSSAVYGTFASVVALLLLLYLAARFYLYGAELNALLVDRQVAEAPETVHPDDVSAAEERIEKGRAPAPDSAAPDSPTGDSGSVPARH